MYILVKFMLMFIIYFSINLLQDMEIVILITIKRIQQHRVCI